MVIADTLEGLIDSRIFFHYDMGNDVLYLRLADSRDRESFGDETPDGVILRDGETDEPVGWTALDWWKRTGLGALPDSMSELSSHIEAWARAKLSSHVE